MTSSRQWLFRLYVGVAIVGAIFPWAIFIPWLAEHGFAPRLFVASLFATPPAAIFSADVMYAAAVFALFVLVEGQRLGLRRLWLPLSLIVLAGLCCALPTFMAMRERALVRAGPGGPLL